MVGQKRDPDAVSSTPDNIKRRHKWKTGCGFN